MLIFRWVKEPEKISGSSCFMKPKAPAILPFGFVEIPNRPEAGKAMKALYGFRIEEQIVKLSQAEPTEKRPGY